MNDIALQEDDKTQRLHEEMEAVWGNPRGWRALSTVNHSSVAVRFMITGGVFFIIGGLLAMLMRTQLALPNHDFMSGQAYNQAFTMHGTVMMFLFAVPILQGLAAYLLPKMLGARDLVFPRLSALGYWCYLFGGIILLFSLFLGIAPDAGWFMYTPLSSNVFSPGRNSDFWLIGVTFVEIATVASAVEITVSILRTRTAGMALHQMPIFAWYMLVTALMIVVGFPPLILGSILLELERAAGLPFFDVTRGGDPILWQHLFWLFGHPEVYIIFLPAAGIVSTLLPVFARRPLVGYRWVVLSVITTGFISFGLWVHHMFTVGIPHLAQAFFSAASMLVAIPTGVQLFIWISTLWTGRPVFRLPMLWLIGFLVIFVAGGLTGVMLALVPFDWQVHDTHFVVAHLHYVLVGGMFFPLMAGIYYWLPHFSGRMPSEQLGRWGFWLNFIGFNGTFFIMHLTGLLGMPRRVYVYDSGLGWDIPNLISSMFSFVLAIGAALVLLDLILHFRYGRVAKPNPWDADTLEWAMPTPPPAYNFASQPACIGGNPLWDQPDLADSIRRGEHMLAGTELNRRETLGSDPLSGKPREIIHLPGNSFLPLWSSLAIAAVCICLLIQTYWLALASSIGALAFLLRWSWENGAHPKAAPEHEGRDGLPLHSRSFDGPGLWGMGITLLANGALFLSLIFAWLYLWTIAPQWQMPTRWAMGPVGLLIVGLLLSAGTATFAWLVARLRKGHHEHLQRALWAAAAFGLAHVLGLLWLALAADLSPTANSHDAVLAVMLGYVLLHSALASILAVLQALRVRIGYVGEKAPYEPAVVAQWWYFTCAAFWTVYASIIVFPRVWGAY